MRRSWLGVARLFLALACTAPSLAQAQGAFSGSWTIDRSVEAPWIVTDDPTTPPKATDLKLYLHKSVTFGPSAITSTSPLNCAHPHYEVRRAEKADTLFQQRLAEGDSNPVTEARKLGMTTPTVPTLVTGCAKMEFHMVRPDTLMFGLPDRVLFLNRAR